MTKKIFVFLLLIVVSLLSAAWFTKYNTASEIPKGWRGIWISNSYDSSIHDQRETLIIEENNLLWLPTTGNTVYMPIKEIRISIEKKIRIEFKYKKHRDPQVPPEDRWHPMQLKENNLIQVFCPFCDKIHTFTRGRG
jgi:hypothetical protein